jgi:DNA-binding LytR/AlgR family response regulator
MVLFVALVDFMEIRKDFETYVCDYLVKPFALERFIIAVDKAQERLNVETAIPGEHSGISVTVNLVFIKTDGKIYKILFDEILYAEAYGNYTKIVAAKTEFLPTMTFTLTVELMPKNIFFRIQRSFIINKSKISHIEGNVVYIGIKEIPIGSNYKYDFMRVLGL